MVAHDSPAELWDIVLEVNQVFGLLVGCYIVEMDIFVAPLEIVDDPFVGELLFDYKDILEKVDDSFFDVKMVEFRNHRLLVFEVPLILVDQCISFIYNISYVVKDRTICAHVKLREFFSKILVFFFLSLKLVVHVFDLDIVSLKFAHNELLIDPSSKSVLYFSKSHSNVRELLNVRL